MPALVNIGAVGWCGISPADGTMTWSRSAQKLFHARRSWLASIAMAARAYRASVGLPGDLIALAPRFGSAVGELLAQLGLTLPHRLSALGHRGPQAFAEVPQRAAESARDPLGGVALDRRPHEPHDPKRHAQ